MVLIQWAKTYVVQKNTEALLVVSEVICLEVNASWTEYGTGSQPEDI